LVRFPATATIRSRRSPGDDIGSETALVSSSSLPERSRILRTYTGLDNDPLRAKAEKARVSSSMRVHDAPRANAWSGMIGVVIPSRRAQASTSLPPTNLNNCTDGTFFDHTSAYSRFTWYSTVLFRFCGTHTSPVMGSTSARGVSFSNEAKP
jgi:hypothetical protein